MIRRIRFQRLVHAHCQDFSHFTNAVRQPIHSQKYQAKAGDVEINLADTKM